MSNAAQLGNPGANKTVVVKQLDRGTKLSSRDGSKTITVPEDARIVQDEGGRRFLSLPLVSAETDKGQRTFKLQAPTGIDAVDTASTQFETMFQQALMQDPVQNVTKQIAYEVPMSGKTLSIPVPLSRMLPREWNGAKQFKNGRVASYSADLLKYEASTALTRIDVNYDLSGVVNAWVNGFMRALAYFDDYLLLTKFNTNTWTGFDGVALLSASHVFATNTNNLSTSAFSAAVLKTAYATLFSFADEYGTPFNIGAFRLKLLAGTTIMRTVKEVLQAETRSQAVDNAGAYDTTSNVVGASQLPNMYQGIVEPIFTPWLNSGIIGSGNQWALIADLGGDARPFVVGVGRDWEPQMQIDMGDEGRFIFDELRFSLEADKVFLPGFWPSIYASVT